MFVGRRLASVIADIDLGPASVSTSAHGRRPPTPAACVGTPVAEVGALLPAVRRVELRATPDSPRADRSHHIDVWRQPALTKSPGTRSADGTKDQGSVTADSGADLQPGSQQPHRRGPASFLHEPDCGVTDEDRQHNCASSHLPSTTSSTMVASSIHGTGAQSLPANLANTLARRGEIEFGPT